MLGSENYDQTVSVFPESLKLPNQNDFFPELSSDDKIDLKSIVYSVPAMVYTYIMNHDTGDCHFPFVSEYCEQIFGLPPSKIIEDTETFVNLVHPDDVNAFAASVLESMKNLTTWDFKMRMRDSDSRIVWVHGKSQPRRRQVTNEDGSRTIYTIWCGTLFDITGDQSEEAKARALKRNPTSDEDTKTNLHRKSRSDQAYFETNKDGEIVFWNDKMSELVGGLSAEKVLGKNFMSFVADSSQDKAKLLGILNNTCSASEDDAIKYFNESTHDIEVLSKNSRNVNLRISTECLNGRQIGWTCQHITELKASELVKMDAAKLLDQEKSLTEWLSHEIRNPLSIAQEAAKFLLSTEHYHCPITKNVHNEMKSQEFYNDTQSLANLIIESIGHVVDLLNNMLDLRKLSDGKIQLRPSMYSLKEDIIRPVHQMMDVKGHNVAISISGEDFNVFIDKLRLKQILTNLVSNALKFTREGFISIRSYRTTKDLSDDGDEESLEISISDTGCGINQKEKDKLFTKWEQLGTNIHGAGLGLCLSRFLARSMGGDLLLNEHYNSTVSGCPGAQFIIRFPLNTILASSLDGCSTHTVPAYSALSAAVKLTEAEHEIKLAQNEPEIKLRDDITNNSFIKGKFNIAVVDDVEVVRKLMKRRFNRIFPDAILTEFICGEEIIEATKKEQYDMIFIDQYMGEGLKGNETIAKLRENNVNSYIVGISGNKKEMCHRTAGGDDFFQKPLPSQKLLVQYIAEKVALPSIWNVMVVDQNSASSSLLKWKLHHIATAHPTKSSNIENHMSIETITCIEDAKCKLKSKFYDLVIICSLEFHDENNNTTSDFIYFIRRSSLNKSLIIVLNTATEVEEDCHPERFNIFWPKPLPSLEVMKKSLLNELIIP